MEKELGQTDTRSSSYERFIDFFWGAQWHQVEGGKEWAIWDWVEEKKESANACGDGVEEGKEKFWAGG